MHVNQRSLRISNAGDLQILFSMHFTMFGDKRIRRKKSFYDSTLLITERASRILVAI